MRRKHGLKPFHYNLLLFQAAQAHTEWMARERKMEHLQAESKSFEEFRTCNNRTINAAYIGWDEVFVAVLGENGISVVTKPDADEHIGEIIAAGWGGGHPASHTETVVTGWMNSSGHRKEILAARYAEMGIGVACTPYGKETFWCVIFGKPTGK